MTKPRTSTTDPLDVWPIRRWGDWPRWKQSADALEAAAREEREAEEAQIEALIEAESFEEESE